MSRLLLAALLLAGTAGAAELAPLHIKLSPPPGWTLNGSQAQKGWASYYCPKVKDPMGCSLDVFFYGNGEPQGSPERYFEKAGLKPTYEKIAGKQALSSTRTVETTLGAGTAKARRVKLEETVLALPHPQGAVVLRLQSPAKRHAADAAVLRKVAASVSPL